MDSNLTTETVEKERPAKKNLLIGVAVLCGLLILSGAAFLGARMLVPRAANDPNGGPGRVMKGMGGGPGGGGNITIERKPAEELPDRNPDINGEVGEVENNSLMVTPVSEIRVMVNEDGETNKDVEYAGAAVEVVVTEETQIYLDITDHELMQEKPPSESIVVEQKLEEAELSQIGMGALVNVWGYKRGDRLIAETIVLEILPQ